MISPAKSRWVVAVLGTAACLGAALAAAQSDEERALDTVRDEIGAIQGRLAREHGERERVYEDLKRAELEIAAAASALRSLRADLQQQTARAAALQQESAQTRQRLAAERDALARQVRATYMNGRQEGVKLLLNQESPARLGRMMVYYDYFNRERSRRIDNVSRELSRLAELATESAGVAQELGALEQAQERKLAELEGARAERRLAVASLDNAIQSSEEEIGRLRDEEQRLAELVAEIEAALAAFPVDSQEPFARIRGNLTWPVAGSALNGYGETRAGGQMTWNGVQLAAPSGTPVRAIYHGRVVYSDWLPGLGLLVIVDHGDGYMSLYGHNEALLKESGDWVVAGEVIAEVGDSGGQARAALYFEIRHDGDPVDPRAWMASEPGPGAGR
jgi:septal ring factor EnvC (AmiA/AmiB activator)